MEGERAGEQATQRERAHPPSAQGSRSSAIARPRTTSPPPATGRARQRSPPHSPPDPPLRAHTCGRPYQRSASPLWRRGRVSWVGVSKGCEVDVDFAQHTPVLQPTQTFVQTRGRAQPLAVTPLETIPDAPISPSFRFPGLEPGPRAAGCVSSWLGGRAPLLRDPGVKARGSGKDQRSDKWIRLKAGNTGQNPNLETRRRLSLYPHSLLTVHCSLFTVQH